MSTAMKSVIVGTAGHIDHGKSTLVEALTGTHPDRLAEEKRRGITSGGACSRNELVADLHHAYKIGHLLGEFQRSGKRIKIKRDNQAAAGMGVEGQGHV